MVTVTAMANGGANRVGTRDPVRISSGSGGGGDGETHLGWSGKSEDDRVDRVESVGVAKGVVDVLGGRSDDGPGATGDSTDVLPGSLGNCSGFYVAAEVWQSSPRGVERDEYHESEHDGGVWLHPV